MFMYRGTHSGWLFKEKGEGALAKWFHPVGRRYFTIDFESQSLIYSHAEGHKQVSHVIAFRDIISAALCFIETGPREISRAPTVGRRASLAPEGTWPFELVTTSRRLRLAAESERDALRWTLMLNAGHTQGRQHLTPKPIKPPAFTSGMRSEDSLAPFSARSDKASQQSTTPGASTPKSSTSASRASTPKSNPEETVVRSWSELLKQSEELDAKPSARAGTPEEPEVTGKEPVLETAATEAREAQIDIHIEEQRPGCLEATTSPPVSSEKRFTLQAADFGFEEDEIAEDEESPLPSPRVASQPVSPSEQALEHSPRRDDDSSDDEMPSGDQASRVLADLLLTQKKATTPESHRIIADLALLQKLMAPRRANGKPHRARHPMA